jgi:hypothetical protein
LSGFGDTALFDILMLFKEAVRRGAKEVSIMAD